MILEPATQTWVVCELPIDCLKIDRAFVNGIEDNLRNQAILSSMIAMANGTELDVIAEGVETKYQYDFLKEKYCHEAQGYLLSRPLSQERTDAFLQKIAPG